MDCPVCHHQNISEFATICPKCDSDLVQFTLLDSIEERYVSNIKQKIANEGDLVSMEKQFEKELSSTKGKINWMLMLMMLMPLIYFTCGKKTVPTTVKTIPSEDKRQLEILTSENKTLKAELSKLKAEQFNVEKIRYVMKKGDNLYDLGKMFFDNPEVWKQVKEYNDITNSRRMMPGDTIFLSLKTSK